MRRLITMALSTVLAVCLVIGIAGITTGCGSSLCDEACDKIEQCSPGSTCTADGGSDQLCQCIIDADCNGIAACIGFP